MGEALKRIQQHKKARQKLAEVVSNASNVVVIHYSCESFYDRPEGRSARITSIAVLNLDSRQTRSFSIHQMAERKKYSLDQLEQNYDELEKTMLQEFYDYVKSHSGYTWLHWNMRNINYGFQAIAHRFKVVGGKTPIDIPESHLVDLSNLFIKIYGTRYIPHQRLPNLAQLNRMTHKDFLAGDEEAKAFDEKQYVKLHLSTLRKVDTLASLAERANARALRTNATWRDLYGSYPDALGEIIREHWIISVFTLIAAIAGFIALF